MEARVNLKTRARRRIETMGFPVSALFTGLFLGERSGMTDGIVQGFRETGTLHLLAISGLHVGILFIIAVLLMKPIQNRLVKHILIGLLMVFYLFLVGPKPSLLRATTAVIVSGTARLLDRDPDPLNILGIVLILILMIDPRSAVTVSFKLSFLACIGILLPGRLLARTFAPFAPRFIVNPFCYSLGAQWMTLPLVLTVFGVYHPEGVIVTVLLIPLLTIFLGSGVVFLLLPNIPAALELFRSLLAFVFKGMSLISQRFSGIPGIRSPSLLWIWLVLGAAVAIGYLGPIAVRFMSKEQEVVE